ncbi:hypothetical protein [Kribbella sp. ALI-6-A]|uniref:hypothetical protein n=1 Tax=Kribbella sp. ALI-6-A TaxID=1933817 RepID=UPI00117BA5CB|nr:hypothetical protein [Kribbella sp. ALI-6-A]
MTAPDEHWFEEISDPGFAGLFISQEHRVLDTRGSVVVSGHCPRCSHPMTFDYSKLVHKGILPRFKASKPIAKGPLPMYCTCRFEHRDRPDDEEGCGAFWSLEVLPQ